MGGRDLDVWRDKDHMTLVHDAFCAQILLEEKDERLQSLEADGQTLEEKLKAWMGVLGWMYGCGRSGRSVPLRSACHLTNRPRASAGYDGANAVCGSGLRGDSKSVPGSTGEL